MKRKVYGRDAQLIVRMFVVILLLAVVYGLFIAALWRAGLNVLTLAAVAGALLAVQYFFSDKLVLWSVGAREVNSAEAPGLHAAVERLAAMMDLPKPRVAIVDSNVPNAFATGRSPGNAMIAVTSSLMNRLDPNELESVLAHELTHVRNRDVMVMTMAGFFAAVAGFLMRGMGYGGMGMGMGYGGGSDDNRRSGGGFVAVFLISLAVWVISFFLIRALSRYREYAADRGSAVITGAPSQLASALVKISGSMQRIPDRDFREVEGANAFFIIPAIRGNSLGELLSTHPSLDNRLARLKRMEQEMETF